MSSRLYQHLRKKIDDLHSQLTAEEHESAYWFSLFLDRPGEGATYLKGKGINMKNFKLGKEFVCPKLRSLCVWKMKPNEDLAAYAHEAWSGWMRYLFSKSVKESDGVKIPQALVDRWTRQMSTSYADLPESEKESDRAEALKMQAIFPSSLDAVVLIVGLVLAWAGGYILMRYVLGF